MNITQILASKKDTANTIKKDYWILLKYKPLGLINLDNKEISLELIEWLKTIPAWFIVVISWVNDKKISENIFITSSLNESKLNWFDFVVCDDCSSLLNRYIENKIAIIINKDNHMTSILKEFDPIKNEGNSFSYENLNKWSIFYSLVRYLENYKFPFDNKNLVKNIMKI